MINNISVGDVVLLGQNFGSNLNQIRVQFTFVPLFKQCCHFVVAHSSGVFQNIINLSNELHVSVFNTIVDHLDIVSTSNRAEVSSARGFWFSGLGSDLCDDGFNQVVRFFGATRHETGPIASSLLTARNPHADKHNVLLGEFFGSSNLIGKPFVSPVNNHIPFIQMFRESRNGQINGLSGLHQKHNLSWFRNLGTKVSRRITTHNGQVTFGLGPGNGCFHLRMTAVSDANLEAMFSHVQGKVLAHYGQSVQANFTTHFCTSTVRRVVLFGFFVGVVLLRHSMKGSPKESTHDL
mmetsp:Transcript_5200/g.10696  ORF Transcript_5200/g.10696 Transcript_5200/m.10696 type:complete len:293 (+) Transcript_5200:790-1668(+)